MPYTPVLPLLYGIKESLALLNDEGIDNVVARHHRCAGEPSPSSDGSGFMLGRIQCYVWRVMYTGGER